MSGKHPYKKAERKNKTTASKATSQTSGRAARADRAPRTASVFQLFTRAGEWRYTGIVLASAYLVVASVIAFRYHKILDFGIESDFLFEYVPVARQIGHGSLPIPQFRGPIYPMILAGLTALVGDYFRAGLVIALVSAATTVALSFSLIRRLFGGEIALATILLLVSNPFFFMFTYQVGTDMIFDALVTGSLYLLVRRTDLSWPSVVVSAVLAGIAYLTRYNGVFIVAAPPLLLLVNPWRLEWRRRVLAGGLFATIFLATIAPWGFYCLKEKGTFFYSENYQNVAYEVYGKGEVTRDEFFWRGNPFEGMSIKKLVVHNPTRFFITIGSNFLGHGKAILMQMLGWPLAILLVVGFILLLRRGVSRNQTMYLSLIFSFFLVLLPIGLEIRYALFPLCGLLALSCCALFLFNPGQLNQLVRVALLAALGVLVAFSAWVSYRVNREQIAAGPPEVVYVADWLKANVPVESRGKLIAARKPHIAYYADLQYLPLPTGRSPEELIRQLSEQNADYLYVGRAEMEMRPELRPLFDPRRSWPGLKKVVSSDRPFSVLYQVEK